MRAQMTAEYLLLSLVALALVAISIAALGRIRDSAGKSLELIAFGYSAEGLHDAMGEVCMMGYGNSRTVDAGAGLTAEPLGRGASCGVRFTGIALKNSSVAYGCSCPLAGSATLRGKTVVRNEYGKITLSSTR